MDNITELKQLTEQEATFEKALEDQKINLNTKIFEFINSLKWEGGLELLPVYVDLRAPWQEKDGKYEIQFNIEFATKNPDRIKRGWESEFACNINVYVYPKKIKLSAGTIGTYSREDVGQVSRALLIAKLWEHDQELIDLVGGALDIEVYYNLKKVESQIRRINDDLEAAKEERKRQETLLLLRQAKYICKRRKYTPWHYDANGKYVEEPAVWTYYDYEEIKKITDVNVLTQDWYGNHRRNLNRIILDIQRGDLLLHNEKKENEPITEENK